MSGTGAATRSSTDAPGLIRRAARLFEQDSRGRGQSFRLATCFAAICGSIVADALFGKNGSSGNLIWMANGLLLAYLLLVPRWRWPAYLAVGFAGLVVGSWFIGESWGTNLFFNILNMVEVGVGAFFLRGKATNLPRFNESRYLMRFLVFAGFGGPFLAVSTGNLVRLLVLHGAPNLGLVDWLTSDGLGVAVVCPIFVAMLSRRHSPSRRWSRDWLYLAMLAVVTLLVFTQSRTPTMFLIYPALIVVLLRLDLGWAATASLFTALAGGWCTVHGYGPLAASPSLTMAQRGMLLQLFVAAGVFMLYSVSVVLEERASIERRLAGIASLHELVSENSRDAIILSDFHGNRSYISAAAARMGGWPAGEIGKTATLALLHPEDQPKARAIVQSLRSGAEGATLECRVRRFDGDYLWVEASLRVVHDPVSGKPTGVLNIVRDVTERKVAEQARAFQHSVLRAIHEASLEGILVVNREGYAVSYNRRFTDIWQIAAPNLPESLDGQSAPLPDHALLPLIASRVKDLTAFVSRVHELYADPDASDQCEIPLLDGRTLERYSTSVRSQAGEYLGRVWFFRDVSAAKLSQHRLETAYSAVEALASTDALTGLANRRRFDHVLSAEWRRGLRERTPISLLMIDADLFKSYNDTYGHPRGDSCLKQIAEVAQDIVARPGDLVARFGGEEFAVILPNTDGDGALRLANAICEAMRSRRLPHLGNSIGIVTVSVGTATLMPGLGRHPVDLVEAADRALYAAKDTGRNRVCCSEPSERRTVVSTVPSTAELEQTGLVATQAEK